MKVLRICVCLFLMVLTLVGCKATSDTLDTDITDYDRQLQIIADNVAVWKGDTEFIAEPIFYAVTDLDQNGRLEIMQSFCQGTGRYTSTDLWEIDANKTGLIPCRFPVDIGDSEPDIITNPDKVYFDQTNDRYLYIFRDDIRFSSAEYVERLEAVSLKDGTVTVTLLAESHSVYDSDIITTYTDADGNTIDESTYKGMADKTYADLKAMQATIGWTDYSVSAQLSALTESELLEILETSWKSFSLV